MVTVGNPSSDLTNEDYTIGWICALKEELAACLAMLDQEHPPLPQAAQDRNAYSLGSIGEHNVVLACLPSGSLGATSAATSAANMVRSFPRLRFGLLVGIGGGVPGTPGEDPEEDIHLGDVVVSHPTGNYGGVLQYDLGKSLQDNRFELTSSLNKPPTVLLNAVNSLRARHEIENNHISQHVSRMLDAKPKMRRRYQHPGIARDILFQTEYIHVGGKSCRDCDVQQRIEREARADAEPVIHYGLIGSANRVMKDGVMRNRLGQEFNLRCLEMEASGLMDDFPCLVIRGICDYCDSHKNDVWQPYAAAVAAAYAKELIETIPPRLVNSVEEAAKVFKLVTEDIADIQATTHQTHLAVRTIQIDDHTSKLKDWLSPPDPSVNHNKSLQQKHPSSGQWFLESSIFSTWRSQPGPFLWLHGIPGCGKTILTSTIVDNLQQDARISKGLLYFYFDFKDTNKQTFDGALRALVYQLYCQQEASRHELDSAYFSCNDGKSQPTEELLWTTLQAMIRHAHEVWIVIDALDECLERESSQNFGLLQCIRDWTAIQQSVIHLIVTSRPEQDIHSGLKDCAPDSGSIAIQSELIKEDIGMYIHDRIRLDRSLSRWRHRPEIQDEIECTLMEKAHGMFRWVSCQLDLLGTCLDYPLLKKALQSLPRTLDETYSRIICNIPPQYLRSSYQLLQFLVFAKRPLRLDEVVDIVAVDMIENPRFDPKNRLPVPEEASRYCSSLVSTTVQEHLESLETTAIVQLAHFSVKEYLLSGRLGQDIGNIFTEAHAQASVADICLAYLLDIDRIASFEELPASRWREFKQEYPLFGYAQSYWAAHAAVAEKSCGKLSATTMEFISSQSTYIICTPPRWGNRTKLEVLLHYACSKGLLYSAQALIERGADVNMSSGEDGSPLVAALRHGHLEIARILIKQGASPNSDGGRFGSPLSEACIKGDREMVQILIDKGANLDAEVRRYGSPLQAALLFSRFGIARLLIRKGASVNSTAGARGSALQIAMRYAATEGDDQMVQMLIESGADVDEQTTRFHPRQPMPYGTN